MGWTEFFQCLNGLHHKTALQFSLNLTETHSEVRGLRIKVSEAIVSKVTRLPQVGRSWFGQRAAHATTVQDFLREGEHIWQTRRGIALQSLPQPWDQVEVFLKN